MAWPHSSSSDTPHPLGRVLGGGSGTSPQNASAVLCVKLLARRPPLHTAGVSDCLCSCHSPSRNRHDGCRRGRRPAPRPALPHCYSGCRRGHRHSVAAMFLVARATYVMARRHRCHHGLCRKNHGHHGCHCHGRCHGHRRHGRRSHDHRRRGAPQRIQPCGRYCHSGCHRRSTPWPLPAESLPSEPPMPWAAAAASAERLSSPPSLPRPPPRGPASTSAAHRHRRHGGGRHGRHCQSHYRCEGRRHGRRHHGRRCEDRRRYSGRPGGLL